MPRPDHYRPERPLDYECAECGNRVRAERHPGECEECGGTLQNVSVARE